MLEYTRGGSASVHTWGVTYSYSRAIVKFLLREVNKQFIEYLAIPEKRQHQVCTTRQSLAALLLCRVRLFNTLKSFTLPKTFVNICVHENGGREDKWEEGEMSGRRER